MFEEKWKKFMTGVCVRGRMGLICISWTYSISSKNKENELTTIVIKCELAHWFNLFITFSNTSIWDEKGMDYAFKKDLEMVQNHMNRTLLYNLSVGRTKTWMVEVKCQITQIIPQIRWSLTLPKRLKNAIHALPQWWETTYSINETQISAKLYGSVSSIASRRMFPLNPLPNE